MNEKIFIIEKEKKFNKKETWSEHVFCSIILGRQYINRLSKAKWR